MGAGFPAPTRSKATGTFAPLPLERGADLLAPRPHRRRPTKRPATRKRRKASLLPGPVPAPLPSMEPTLAVPSGWTGQRKQTPAPNVEAALERQLSHPSRPLACITGHPDGPEPAQAMLRSARIPRQPVRRTAIRLATAHGQVTFGKGQLPCSYGSCRSRPGGQSRRRAVTSPERPSPILRTGVRLAPFAPATPVFGRVRHNGQVPWFAHLTTSICRRH
jgi:hypothetical protein